MNQPTDELLLAALAPLRPDRDTFRSATLSKVQQRAAARRESTISQPGPYGLSAAAPGRRAQRRAAAVLPLQLLPGLTKGLTKGPGSAWLSLPLASLVAVAATFLWAVAKLARLRDGTPGSAVDAAGADAIVRSWWSEHALPALLTLALLAGTAIYLPAAALLGVGLASTIHLTLVTARLAGGGQTSGENLGRVFSQFLGLLGCVLLIGADWNARWRPTELSTRIWVPMALIGGSFLCEWIGGWRRKSPGLRAAGFLPLLVLGLLVGLVLTPRMQRPSRARIVHWAETFHEPVHNSVEWLRFGRVVDRLDENAKLRLAPARAMLAHAQRYGPPIPRATASGAILAGLLPAEPGIDPDMQLGPGRIERTEAEFTGALAATHGNPVGRVGALHGGLRLALRRGSLASLNPVRLHQELMRLATPGWVEALSPRWLRQLTIQPYRMEAAVALERLEASPEWSEELLPPTSPWNPAALALIVAGLLVGLCGLVTLRAEIRTGP